MYENANCVLTFPDAMVPKFACTWNICVTILTTVFNMMMKLSVICPVLHIVPVRDWRPSVHSHLQPKGRIKNSWLHAMLLDINY